MDLSLRSAARLVSTALILGVAADVLIVGQHLGVNLPIFFGVGLIALALVLAAEGQTHGLGRWWPALVALFFAGCVAWRAAPALVALNLLAAFGLAVLLALNFGRTALLRQPLDEGVAALVGGVADMGVAVLPPVAVTVRGARLERVPVRKLGPVAVGLGLALPVVAVFGGLLMAADSAFASLVAPLLRFELPFDVGLIIHHTLLIGAFAWLCGGGLAVALRGERRTGFGRAFAEITTASVRLFYRTAAERALPAEGDTQHLGLSRAPLSLPTVTAVTLLAAVDALFLSFTLVQGAYLFGGLDTLARTGMSYADYARRGFFELITVAALAFGLVCALAVATRRDTPGERRWFRVASALLIALVLGLLGSALLRMGLYERAYGYTQLRLYTQAFMGWLAIALLLLLLALLRDRARPLVTGGLLAGLAVLAALNVINPDALIVRENIARVQQTGELDHEYFSELSADAVPELARQIPLLPEPLRAPAQGVLEQLTQQQTQESCWAGWRGWHYATWQAARLASASACQG